MSNRQHDRWNGSRQMANIGSTIDLGVMDRSMHALDRANKLVEKGSEYIRPTHEYPNGRPWRPLIPFRELVELLRYPESRAVLQKFRRTWLGLDQKQAHQQKIRDASYRDLEQLTLQEIQILRDYIIAGQQYDVPVILYGLRWPAPHTFEACVKILRRFLYGPCWEEFHKNA